MNVGFCPGRNRRAAQAVSVAGQLRERSMNSIIYIVGLVVVVAAVLGFFGLR